MALDEEVVREFQKAYYEAFGERIFYDEAALMSREILQFARWLLINSERTENQ